MTEENSIRMYRCVLDGSYFTDKGTAMTHVKLAHQISEETVLREVTFPLVVTN